MKIKLILYLIFFYPKLVRSETNTLLDIDFGYYQHNIFSTE